MPRLFKNLVTRSLQYKLRGQIMHNTKYVCCIYKGGKLFIIQQLMKLIEGSKNLIIIINYFTENIIFI